MSVCGEGGEERRWWRCSTTNKGVGVVIDAGCSGGTLWTMVHRHDRLQHSSKNILVLGEITELTESTKMCGLSQLLNHVVCLDKYKGLMSRIIVGSYIMKIECR